MVNSERMLAEFFDLIRIYSPTRGEREVADYVKTRLSSAGLSIEEDDVGNKIGGNSGNVFAYLKGSVPDAPIVLFTAHMDSVEPCRGIEPQITDGLITSAGETILGSDDKAGITAILEGIRMIREEGAAHGDVQVVFTVAEEGGLNGAANLDRNRLKADFGYALDSGGEPGTIIILAPGQNSIKVTMHGKSAHAGVEPEAGVNAITVAGKAIAVIRQGRIDSETTANVGIIKGGYATNIVPDKVEIFCEARSRNMDKLQAQTLHMKEVFESVAAENRCRAEVIIEKMYDPYVLSEKSPVVKVAAKATESLQKIPVFQATGGGSDANFFNSYGVPMAVLGVGMTKVHSVDESIKEQDLYASASLVAAIIKAAAGKQKDE